MNNPHCCTIDCTKDAEFTIYGASGHPEDYTQACEGHVGVLLDTLEWLPQENKSWTVYHITGYEEEI